MKKTLSLVLCLLLLLQAAGFALAEESNADAELTVILNADAEQKMITQSVSSLWVIVILCKEPL